MRYTQLIDIIKEVKPNHVLEIGTHKAARPREWYNAHKFEKYYGFDIFDEGTQELNVKEMNGKGFCTRKGAKQALGVIPHTLFQGLTSNTLPIFKDMNPDIKIDFAFIDGGHSIHTIREDWEHVKSVMRPGGVVVFDDYYLPPRHGFGCNRVVEDLDHKVLPQSDVGVYLVRVDIT